MATVVAERHGSWAAVWAKRESLYVLGPVFLLEYLVYFSIYLLSKPQNLIISPSSEVRIY